MPAMTRKDLHYNYSWKAVPGDDPKKTKEDAARFSRKEGYEVLTLLNSLVGEDDADLPVHVRQVCEWMIHEKLPSGIQGRTKVINWIAQNYPLLSGDYPH